MIEASFSAHVCDTSGDNDRIEAAKFFDKHEKIESETHIGFSSVMYKEFVLQSCCKSYF